MPVHRATVDPMRVVGLDVRAMGRDLPRLGWAQIVDTNLDEPSSRCRRLWQHVLLRAIEDSLSIRIDCRAQDRDEARRWLVRTSVDRAVVLDWTDYDEDWFVSVALPALMYRWRAVDAQIDTRLAARQARKREAPAGRVEGPGAAAGAPEASLAA